jgi:hypothetical protein
MGLRGAQLLVVVALSWQPDLFGGLHPVHDEPTTRLESNDVDLLHTVAANAVRCGYLLVGVSERVYARTNGEEVARVPRYEEDAVHQLLRRRWLTSGAPHAVTCGAASLRGTALLVPKHTRAAVARWEQRQRPPSWPHQQGTATPDSGRPDQDPRAGRVVRLDDQRRRRR